jgi:hypothetical protein
MPDWKGIGAILAALGFMVSSTLAVEYRYAKNDRLKLVEMRLEQKIQQDRYWWLKDRLQRLNRAYPDSRRAPTEIREECGNLEREIMEIEKSKGENR